MQLQFLGANRQVTGSRYCLEAAGKRVLVDCGLFQERPFVPRNWEPSPISPESCAALLLTHVHIDHSGLIPKFVRDGFRGPIYTTRASAALLGVMLRDAAKIQEEDAAYKRKRHQRENRRGRYPELPLYTDADVDRVLPLVVPVAYGQPVKVADGVTATFHDAGHILGSAMVEVVATEAGRARRIIFSGDIGQWHKPLIRDPSIFTQADYVVMESTYGDRNHENGGDVETQLADVIHATAARGGNVVIPTFAVERAQELLFHLGRLVHAGRIPEMKVFLDSPMAVDVGEIFVKFPDEFDEETSHLIRAGKMPLRFPGLHLVRSVEDSKRINFEREPCLIMATSGMCNAGRIKHHLRQNIGRAESTILFVGYQGEGTLGRQILQGDSLVRIHGELRKVKAQRAQIFGFSAHADRSGLLRWLGNFQVPPRQIFLTHGEEVVALKLRDQLARDPGWNVSVPEYQQVVELS